MKYKSHPIIDNGIALRLLTILCTPFKEFPAYKSGVIDEKGKYIVPKASRTSVQKKTLTYLDRLMINVKKIINKLPGGENKLKNIVTAMFLIKESLEKETDNPDLLEYRQIHSETLIESDKEFERMIIKSFMDYQNLVENTRKAQEIVDEDCTTAGVATVAYPMGDMVRRKKKEELLGWIDDFTRMASL